MTRLAVRRIFSEGSLARLTFDEPVTTADAETGIQLHYRFEDMAGGRLRMTGGLLRDQLVSVGCQPDDLNLVATIMLSGLKAHLT